jgi:uncharacterized protein YjdB
MCKLLAIPILIFALSGSFAHPAAARTAAPQPLSVHVCYRAHVQSIGWQNEVCDGAVAGTTGRSLRMEAITIRLVNAAPGVHVCYQAHVQSIGWQGLVCDGAVAGTTGRSLRLEAIRIWTVTDAPTFPSRGASRYGERIPRLSGAHRAERSARQGLQTVP